MYGLWYVTVYKQQHFHQIIDWKVKNPPLGHVYMNVCVAVSLYYTTFNNILILYNWKHYFDTCVSLSVDAGLSISSPPSQMRFFLHSSYMCSRRFFGWPLVFCSIVFTAESLWIVKHHLVAQLWLQLWITKHFFFLCSFYNWKLQTSFL